MKDMIKSTLTGLRIASNLPPRESLTQEPSQDPEKTSEEEEDSHQGEPLLVQLLLFAEEQRDYDSVASPSGMTLQSPHLPITKTPLWKVSQENPQIILWPQLQMLNHQ